MSQPEPTADRRQCPRFVPAGVLGATLELRSAVILDKIGPSGAVVEVQLLPALKTLRFAQLILNDRGERLNAWVRQVDPLTAAPQENRYRIVLEFANVSPAGQADLNRIFSQDEYARFRVE
jgi:hypothetical protein